MSILLTYFTPFSGLSIVDQEQVNVSWGVSLQQLVTSLL